MNILIIQNSLSDSKYLEQALKEAGNIIQIITEYDEVLDYLSITKYDIVVLDYIIDNKSGIELCGKIRKHHKNIGIIIISQEVKASTKVLAFNSGADDYLVRPISLLEFVARLKALFRRVSMPTFPVENNMLIVKDITLDYFTREVRKNGVLIELSPKEYSILEYLMRNKNIVVTRSILKEQLWGIDFLSNTNIVDVYVTHLRKKINDTNKIIQTVRGAGYIIRD